MCVQIGFALIFIIPFQYERKEKLADMKHLMCQFAVVLILKSKRRFQYDIEVKDIPPVLVYTASQCAPIAPICEQLLVHLYAENPFIALLRFQLFDNLLIRKTVAE